VRDTLARIASTGPELNAICCVDPQAAVEAAQRADAGHARGLPPGPLHGVPITVKDCFEVAGLPATCGASALRDYRPASTAAAVLRLTGAGAIVIGKSNVPPYALDLETRNDVFGQTRNPWSLDRSPGGSSGGAAAAVAAGLVAAELGTDLAGSLRIPAHYCGVSALKPSYGRISLAGTISGPPPCLREPDLAVAGPIARNVGDLRLLFGVLAGESAGASVTRHADLRIAVWVDEEVCPVDDGVRSVLGKLCGRLRSAGATLEERARPAFDPRAYFRHFLQMLYGEVSASLPEAAYRALCSAARNDPPGTWTPLTAMRDGVSQSHRDWLVALDERARYRAAWAEFFARYDAVLTPVAPTVAPAPDMRPFEQRTILLGARSYPVMQQTFWVGLATAAGLPAVAVPAGCDESGLPVGVQLIGGSGGEPRLLDIAGAVETLTGGFTAPPLFA
jgi:amidase